MSAERTEADVIRVVVADDTPEIRLLMRLVIESHLGFEIVGEAANGAEAVIMAAECNPDIVLLDLAMPVMDGLQAAPRIKRSAPNSSIVMFSDFPQSAMAEEALRQGVSAYVQKGTQPNEIVSVIREVYERS